MLTRGREGVRNPKNLADVICERPKILLRSRRCKIVTSSTIFDRGCANPTPVEIFCSLCLCLSARTRRSDMALSAWTALFLLLAPIAQQRSAVRSGAGKTPFHFRFSPPNGATWLRSLAGSVAAARHALHANEFQANQYPFPSSAPCSPYFPTCRRAEEMGLQLSLFFLSLSG